MFGLLAFQKLSDPVSLQTLVQTVNSPWCGVRDTNQAICHLCTELAHATISKRTLTQKNESTKTTIGQKNKNEMIIDGESIATKKCTFSEALSNSLAYLMSIGMLSMPYTVKQGGFFIIIPMVMICLCTFITGLILDELLNHYKHVTNYSELVYAILGKKGRYVSAMIAFAELFLYVMVIFIFAGNLLYTMLANFLNVYYLSKRECIIIMGILFTPLFQLTDLKPLAKLSWLGLCGVLTSYGIVYILFVKHTKIICT